MRHVACLDEGSALVGVSVAHTMPRVRGTAGLVTGALLLFTLVPMQFLQSQKPTGSLQGTVYDSLTARPLAGALVEVSGSTMMATTDKQGRFRIDSLPTGAHRVSFSAAELDSIGLFGFARDVQVRADGIAELALSTPSFNTMYAQLCAPAPTAPADSAIVFGTIYDASTGERVDSARVHFVWQASNVIDRQVRLVDYSRDARANTGGDYGICGLPAEVLIATQALTLRSASGRVITAIGAARIVRRDFYVSREMPTDADTPPVRGKGIVRGRVRNTSGEAIANANVRLASADTIVQTDTSGHFAFSNAPLGTQHVEARLAGRTPAFAIVHVRRDESADAEIVMLPVTPAPSRAPARPIGIDQRAYLEHKENARGQFIDRQLIVAQANIVAVLQLLGGLDVRNSLNGIDIATARGRCMPLLVIDGKRTLQFAVFRQMVPRQLVAVEFYEDPAASPPEYTGGVRTNCGMLVLWTTGARW